MTEREIKDNIMLALLQREGEHNISIETLCNEENLSFSSDSQKRRVFQSLRDLGYITGLPTKDGVGYTSITSEGVEYAERLIEKELKKTDKAVKSGNFILDIDENTNESQVVSANGRKIYNENDLKRAYISLSKAQKEDDDISIEYYTNLISEIYSSIQASSESFQKENTPNKNITNDNPNITDEIRNISSDYLVSKENYEQMRVMNVPPCFGVDNLVNCFIKHLATLNDAISTNICMIGIFGSWGRGKTYFFDQIKKSINERSTIQYDIVEFNAWKYQETPAIWAYLFETIINTYYKKGRNKIFKHGCIGYRKLIYTLRHNWKKIVSDLIIYLIPIFIALILSKINPEIGNWFIWGIGVGSIALFILKELSQKYNEAISLIKKYSKVTSFKHEMGIKAEIESELESLLKFWIKEEYTLTRKILLYIDDVDRCSENQMVAIIDSLRTILDNTEIRKRLVIVCSVDSQKLIEAIKQKYKKLIPNNDIAGLRNIAVEQMDKIFISGITLAPIDYDQQVEYLREIAKQNDGITENQTLQSLAPFSTTKKYGSLVAFYDETIEPSEISQEKIFDILKELLKVERDTEITPRKLRIIYYRMLLANNIISTVDGAFFSKNIFKYIFDLSLGKKIDITSEEAFIDVVQMVMPYSHMNKISIN